MIKTLALILKKQNLGEADRIITVLTPALGKKRLVARAVRRPLSKLAGHLDSLMVTQLIITNKENLPQITSAIMVESFENARDSLELLGRTYAVGKVAEKLAEENTPQQSLFQTTVDAFARINNERNWEATWLYFLAQLCRQFGVYISNFSCGSCGQPIIEAARFNIADRALFHDDHATVAGTRRLSGNSVKLLRL
ncbi:MAG: DNA repair protein RecO, partial [Patescibacteria group bacterium]